MSRKKKLFGWLSALFLALLLYASYDISRRTTFPGSKGQLKERINEEFLEEGKVVDKPKEGNGYDTTKAEEAQ